MNEDVRESEQWAWRNADLLSVVMKADSRNAPLPDYIKEPPALAVTLAGAFSLPCYRMLAERVQAEHRAAHHGGGRSQDCEACGYFDGAVYKATTGREFTQDFPELFTHASAVPPSTRAAEQK